MLDCFIFFISFPFGLSLGYLSFKLYLCLSLLESHFFDLKLVQVLEGSCPSLKCCLSRGRLNL